MGHVRSRDTKPEMTVRQIVHAMGYRYRLHAKDLPGKPDLVFRSRGKIVFIHGCFWHRHEGCRYTTTPRTNEEFWQRKFLGNVDRDRRHVETLRALGWRVAIVWECALKHSIEDTARLVDEWLHGNEEALVIAQSASASNGT